MDYSVGEREGGAVVEEQGRRKEPTAAGVQDRYKMIFMSHTHAAKDKGNHNFVIFFHLPLWSHIKTTKTSPEYCSRPQSFPSLCK